MGSPEFHELHEQVEHGAHNPSLAPVSLTMAILAMTILTTTALAAAAMGTMPVAVAALGLARRG